MMGQTATAAAAEVNAVHSYGMVTLAGYMFCW
jgi:hypothetical protein